LIFLGGEKERGMRDVKQGFTLLEVMIALAIIAISLVVILHSHALSISRVNQAKNILVSSLLAEEQMAEVEMLGFSKLKNSSGVCVDYPGFHWKRIVSPTPFDEVKKAVVHIFWEAEGSEKDFKLETYISKMK